MFDVEPDSQSLMPISSSAPSPTPDSVPLQGDLNSPAAPATNANSHPSSDMAAETTPLRQPTDVSPTGSHSLTQPLSALLIDALLAAGQEPVTTSEDKPGQPNPREAPSMSSATQQATGPSEDDSDSTLVDEMLQRQQATMAKIQAHMLVKPEPWWQSLLADKVCLSCKHLISPEYPMLHMAIPFQLSEVQCCY